MNKDINEIKATLVPKLTEKLHAHHALYRLPCTGEYLEELVSDSLNEGGILNDWEPNRSHRISLDMETGGGSISVKSGIVRDGYLRFSGSRLGKYKTLEERINHIQNTRSDIYVCLAKNNSFNPKLQVYKLFIFEKDLLDYSGSWEKINNQDILIKENLQAFVVHSMSSQLWTHAWENITGKPTIIPINGAVVYEQQLLQF